MRMFHSNPHNWARTSALISARMTSRKRKRSQIQQTTLQTPRLKGRIAEAVEGFRAPGGPASIPEILKFLIDRTGYIKQLEEEATPDSLARIDNLRELVNAAMDSRDRGETLAEFLDHAALVSDVDTYDPRGTVTLMTLHSAKGLEFGLVFLVGMEEGLFPHSRAFNDPDQMEEERRLCYVGHDARHGPSGAQQCALSPALWHGHAGRHGALKISGGSAATVAGRTGHVVAGAPSRTVSEF